MYWLNLAVTLLLILGLAGLLLLTAADLFGLLRSSRWRAGTRQAAVASPPDGDSPGEMPAAAAQEEPALAWVLYTRSGKVEHSQPLTEGRGVFLGRQAFPGLDRAVALRAAEAAWRDGMPALRSLDPTSPLRLRLPGEADPVPVDAGGGWEPWPEDAEVELGGYVLKWRENEADR